MKLNKHENRAFNGRMRILMSGMMLFFMGILVGILSGNTLAPETYPETENISVTEREEAPETESAGAILESTRVDWITVFTDCGHMCTSSAQRDITGMTEEELRETYDQYKVQLFSQERVELRQEVSGYCPDHFILLEEAGELCVKKRDPHTLIPCRIVTLSAEPDLFPEAERIKLKAGIPFDSLAEIDAFFEGIDS